jgi:hypothetical protein
LLYNNAVSKRKTGQANILLVLRLGACSRTSQDPILGQAPGRIITKIFLGYRGGNSNGVYKKL